MRGSRIPGYQKQSAQGPEVSFLQKIKLGFVIPDWKHQAPKSGGHGRKNHRPKGGGLERCPGEKARKVREGIVETKQ